jgi:hypothetical protein
MTDSKAPEAHPSHHRRQRKSDEASPEAVAPFHPSPSAQRLSLHAPGITRINKTDVVIAMLRRSYGASIDEMMVATGWQRHSVRGALAGAVRKKVGAAVTSDVVEGVRRYRAPRAAA